MTTPQTLPAPPEPSALFGSGLDDLAVADPANDPCFDFVAARLDAALTRVARRLSGRIDGAAHAQLELAADVLAALPDAARRRVVTHPYSMYWLVKQYERCLVGDRAQIETAMFDIGRFVLLPALQHDCLPDRELLVRARGGQLRFPGFPRHVLLPYGTPDGPVRVGIEDDRVTFRAAGCDIHVPVEELLGRAEPGGGSPVAQRPVIPGSDIEVDGTDAFVGELMTSINSRPPMPGYPPRDLAGMPFVGPAALDHLGAACDLLDRAWPEAGAELRSYTRLVVPFVSRCYSTFAEAAFLGAVFMGECRHPFSDLMYTAEHLLHEHSHLRLRLIMEQDPVYYGDPNALVTSPWRRDPRPLIGIVQGVFVFARVARFLRRAYDLLGEERFAVRHHEVTADLRGGLETLRDPALVRFTPVGQAIVDQCELEAQR
ncbi:aKG-HExxH-type peptide beta-hydroxylase [Cryptosporangium sp. NPDC051539]|uniref:aKG-HExxH-type peptide beta-hydroxylase n=1 Tax=Cryptosporangium sp. NPDC051539 TaxID=3363962 RepID=UPI0037B13CDE